MATGFNNDDIHDDNSKRRKMECSDCDPFGEGRTLTVHGRRYIDYDKLFPKIETLAIFANIMPLWFLKMATLVDKVDCLPGCSIDKDGRVHPANYPTDWLDSEIYGSEKIEYNSMAQLVHPRGRYMERFRHLVWTRTCSGKYLGKVEMSCVEECMKKYLLDMGWKEEWIDKCLRAKCTEHFDWEVVDGGRRDHLRDDW